VGGAATPLWKFSSWIPDIVSIFLGINDKNAGATDNEYTTAVHSFVTTIRGNYPNAPILFISLTGNMDAATRNAVAAETTSLGHKGVYFLECTVTVTGCQYHPTLAEDKKISDAVVAKIRQITGWDTTVAATARAGSRPTAGRTARIKTVRIDGSTIMVSADQAARQGIMVMRADGRIVERWRLDRSGTCRWNTAQAQEGLYLIGGQGIGWARVCIRR